MTKQVRDWQEDMEMCEQSKANGFSDGLSFLTILPEIGIYWLQQYAAEKERADKLEERNKALIAAVTADANGTFRCVEEARSEAASENGTL